MGDQFAMWKLATHGLTSIIKDPGIRGQYSTALLSDILTLNALKYNPQLGNLPENVQPDLIGWLSNLWNNPQDNYAVYGNIDDPQAFHQAGFNAVGVLIDNLLKYEIQPHDARRHNALFNVIEYYMELDRREAVSGLTRLLDVEEEDVRSTVVEYLHNFAQEYSNEVINQFHELAVGQEEERIVAAKIMAFLPKKQRNIGLYNDVNKLTDDPSYEVRQYALVSAGQIEGDKHTMSPLRTRLRNLIERRRTDDHADVRIYLYSHLPQVVSPDLALAVCEQGFSEMGMEFHENIIKGFHAAVSKWIDSGELAREPLKSKVWAFFKKWQSEIGDEVIPLTPQERLRASLMFPGTGAR
jgi:hypothetical protein